MSVRGAVLLALLVPALGSRGCGGAEVSEENAIFACELELSDATGVARASFAPGQAITANLTLRNPGAESERITLRSSQTYDLIVTTPSGEELWRWSQGRYFAQVITELVLAPGEAREFKAIWTPGEGGVPAIEAGRYEVVGFVPSSEIRSRPVTFTIE